MFAYCNNNPTNAADSDGNRPFANYMATDSGTFEWDPDPTDAKNIPSGSTVQSGYVEYHGYHYQYNVRTVDSIPSGSTVFYGGTPDTIVNSIRPDSFITVELFNTKLYLDRHNRTEAYGHLGGYLCCVEIIMLKPPTETSKQNVPLIDKFKAFIDYLATAGDHGAWAEQGGISSGGGGGLVILHPVMY